MNARDIEVIDAMRRYGGGFVKALAELATCADDENLARVKLTWPEYWIRYGELADRRREHLAKGGA
jgi:hypothetical protein